VKACKLDIKRIAGRHPNNASPFAGISGHDGTRLIAGETHKIADFRDHDLGAIGSGVYQNEDFTVP